MNSEYEVGSIVRWIPEKCFGFITRSCGEDAFLHADAWRGEGAPRVGAKVRFRVVDAPKGPRATDVTGMIDDDIQF